MLKKINKKSVSDFIDEAFEAQNWKDLKVDGSFVKNSIITLLPRTDVKGFHFLPIFDEGKLETVHVVFITYKTIFYCKISEGSFEFRNVPISNFRIKVEMEFHQSTKTGPHVKCVKLLCDVGDYDTEGKPLIYNIELPPDLLKNLFKGIALINRLRERDTDAATKTN